MTQPERSAPSDVLLDGIAVSPAEQDLAHGYVRRALTATWRAFAQASVVQTDEATFVALCWSGPWLCFAIPAADLERRSRGAS